MNLSRVRRRFGLQCPWNIYQSFAVFTYVALTALFLSAWSLFSMEPLLVYFISATCLSTFISWLLVELADTEKIATVDTAFAGMRVTSSLDFYCPACNKMIDGMDHHCVWLNQCIARANYKPFIGLLTSVGLQSILQFVYGCKKITQLDTQHPHTDRYEYSIHLLCAVFEVLHAIPLAEEYLLVICT